MGFGRLQLALTTAVLKPFCSLPEAAGSAQRILQSAWQKKLIG
jgi:hypothetical protein